LTTLKAQVTIFVRLCLYEVSGMKIRRRYVCGVRTSSHCGRIIGAMPYVLRKYFTFLLLNVIIIFMKEVSFIKRIIYYVIYFLAFSLVRFIWDLLAKGLDNLDYLSIFMVPLIATVVFVAVMEIIYAVRKKKIKTKNKETNQSNNDISALQ